MTNHYTQIQFIAANYSRMQGFRVVPVGLLTASTSLWIAKQPGDLGIPLVMVLGSILLYWLIDRFYIRTFGRIQQTPKTRRWEVTASVLFALLAMAAFVLDTALELPVSVVGMVFAAALFDDYWRVTSSVKERSFALYPENLVAATLILALSLLPLTGLTWWKLIGMESQILAILFVDGILLIITGIWGHIRIVRVLPAGEASQ